MGKLTIVAACLMLLLCSTLNGAQADTTHTPKAGSAERKAIMDALRKPVMQRVKRKIIFQVGYLKVRDGWALMSGSARNPDGSSLSDKYLWGEVTGLLRKKGSQWQVLHWGFATDTSVMDEAKKRYPKAPRAIFPY
jgi:hypothetical protein